MLKDCADTPVLIVSGREDAEDVATWLGARDFLKKPVRIRRLL